MEDLTAKEQAMAGKVSPPGLANLGNTCYLNSAPVISTAEMHFFFTHTVTVTSFVLSQFECVSVD